MIEVVGILLVVDGIGSSPVLINSNIYVLLFLILGPSILVDRRSQLKGFNY